MSRTIWLMALLTFCHMASLSAAETSKSLAARLRELNTARADTSVGITIMRSGTVNKEHARATVSVTAYQQENRARYDLTVNELTDLTPIDTTSTTNPKSGKLSDWKDFRNPSQGNKQNKERKSSIDSRIMVNDGTGWTDISSRSKSPNAEFSWEDMAVMNWLTPEQLLRGTVAGEEKVRGRNCWVVEWKSGQFSKLWVDQSTMCLVRAISKSGRKGGEYRLEWSDFREVEGAWEMPYRSELVLDNQTVTVLTSTEVKVSRNLWDGLFDAEKIDKPKSAKQSVGLGATR